eukprot:GAHX01002455.1.p1 GENE.GAHX01002455.1~~GAHX01002455.1.p1  ORF type:complete len:664 (-),score=194.64 GAHX01002455.1:36-2027(-)
MDSSMINSSMGYDKNLSVQDVLNEMTQKAKNIKIDSNGSFRAPGLNSPITKRNTQNSNQFQFVQDEDFNMHQNVVREMYHELEEKKKNLQTRQKDIEEAEAAYEELEKNFNKALAKIEREKTELDIREKMLKENEEEFNTKKNEWLETQYDFNKDKKEGKLFMESYENLKEQQLNKLEEIERKTKQLNQKEKEVNDKLERNGKLEEQSIAKEEILKNKEKIFTNKEEELIRKIDDVNRKQRALTRKEFDMNSKLESSAVYKKEKELLTHFENEKDELVDKIESLKLENDGKLQKITNLERKVEKLQLKITEGQSNQRRLVNVFGNEDKIESLNSEDSFNLLFSHNDSVNVSRVNSDIVEIVKLRERKLKQTEKLINKDRSDLELNYSSKINALRNSHVKFDQYKTKFMDAYSKLTKLKKDIESRMDVLKRREFLSKTNKYNLGALYKSIYKIKTDVVTVSKDTMEKLSEQSGRNNETLFYLKHKMDVFREIQNKPASSNVGPISTSIVGKNAENYIKAWDMCMKHAVMNFFIKMKFKDPFIENLKYVLLKMGEVNESIYKREFISFALELKKMLWLDYGNVRKLTKIKNEEVFGQFDLDTFMDLNKYVISNLINENVLLMRSVTNLVVDVGNKQKLDYQKIFSVIRQITSNIQKQERIMVKDN